jgi:HK97 gp10 family phage protein
VSLTSVLTLSSAWRASKTSVQIDIIRSGLELEVVSEQFEPQVAQKLVERLADLAWSEAFWEAPWRTGYLAGSVVKDVGVLTASIKPLASYAIFVEKGTAPHLIRPVNASVLAFEAASGEMVFTRLVRHPGTRPNPFMRRAADATEGKVLDVFTELWKEMTE